MAADALLSRDELEQLTDTVQPKRMAAWLVARGWVFEPASRRGGIPAVLKSYAQACMDNGGVPPAPRKTAAEWEASGRFTARKREPWLTPARRAYLAGLRADREARREEDAAAWAALMADAPRMADQAREARAALIRFHAAKRRAARLKRTPPWADRAAILAVYQAAREATVRTGQPHHVDHVCPLQGELVSGLHVHTNLQVLPGVENSRKRNRFEVEG